MCSQFLNFFNPRPVWISGPMNGQQYGNQINGQEQINRVVIKPSVYLMV